MVCCCQGTLIKQGGMLLPRYFNSYINDIIAKLRISGLGCNLIGIYSKYLFFADDIIFILSASVTQLQLMLTVIGLSLDLKLPCKLSIRRA